MKNWNRALTDALSPYALRLMTYDLFVLLLRTSDFALRTYKT
jgi:hypothetical protein